MSAPLGAGDRQRRLLAPVPESLAATLSEYLELEIRRLRADEAARERAEQQRRLTSEVGQMVSWALLLAAYALLVAILAQRTLLNALLVPSELPGLVASQVERSFGGFETLPSELRGIVVPLTVSLLLLVYRSTPFGARLSAGATGFAALVALSLLGLSAGVLLPPWGTLAALAGAVMAVVVVHQFGGLLQRVDWQATGGARDRAADAGWLRAVAVPLGRLHERLRLEGWRLGAFLLLPVAASGAIALAVAIQPDPVSEGPLKALGQAGLVAWLGWGIVVTPPALRLVLWSIPAWALAAGWFVGAGVTGAVFLGLVLLTVMASLVLDAVALHRSSAARPGGALHLEGQKDV